MAAAQLQAASRPCGLQRGYFRASCVAVGTHGALRSCRLFHHTTTSSSGSVKASSTCRRSELLHVKAVRGIEDRGPAITNAAIGTQALLTMALATSLVDFNAAMNLLQNLAIPGAILLGLLKGVATSAATALLVHTLARLVVPHKPASKPLNKKNTMRYLPAAGESSASASSAARDLRLSTASILLFLASIPFSETFGSTFNNNNGPKKQDKEDNRGLVGAGIGGTAGLGRCKRHFSKATTQRLYMTNEWMSPPLAEGGSHTPGPLPNPFPAGDNYPGPGWFFLKDLADAAGCEKAGWVKLFINSTGDGWDCDARPFCFEHSPVLDFTSVIHHPCHGAIKPRGLVPVVMVVWRPLGDHQILVGRVPAQVLASLPPGVVEVIPDSIAAAVSSLKTTSAPNKNNSGSSSGGAATFIGEPCLPEEEAAPLEPVTTVFELSDSFVTTFKRRAPSSRRSQKVEVPWATTSRFGDDSDNSSKTAAGNKYDVNKTINAISKPRLALPPAGGSSASLGPLLARLSGPRQLSAMAASSRLLLAVTGLAPGVPRPWPSVTPSPFSWVGPAGPLAASAGEVTAPVTLLVTPSVSTYGPQFEIKPLTLDPYAPTTLPASSPRQSLALLAAPKAPFGLLPASTSASMFLALPYDAPLSAGPLGQVVGEVASPGVTTSRAASPQPAAVAPSSLVVDANNISLFVETLQVLQGPLPLVTTPATAAPAAGSSLVITTGSYQHLGRKTTQEDFLVTRSSPLAAAGDTLTMTTAAVFDGHAGAGIARAAAQSLPGRLEQAYLRDGFTAGFAAEFVAFDTIAKLFPAEKSGSTAAVALVAGDTLVTANVGDSSIILVKRDGSSITLSEQHNTLHKPELERVRREGGRLRAYPVKGAAGGVVHRVTDASGKLGLLCTRSLGDFTIKRGGPGLTCLPYTTTTALNPEEDVAVVVVSDGVTDVMHPVIIGMTVSDALVLGCDASAVASRLVDTAVSAGVDDNTSAAVMLLSWE